MPHSDRVGVVDFPTLGHLLDGWYEAHCAIPDGFQRGKPYRQYDWQFWCTANHYRVREDATWRPGEKPLANQAFVYRRSLVVGVQKLGKGPQAACWTAGEAVGPTQFAGWAKAGDAYDCADHGCGCGWGFDYDPGEPMGARHPSPLIQVTATSQDQVDNIWRPLLASIRVTGSPLADLLAARETFIRVLGLNDDPDLDRIDAVTAEAMSRLGNPISFAVQDETGTWTTPGLRKLGTTQRRGLAGMGGRSIETTNPWDPAEESTARATWETSAPDVWKYYPIPPAGLSFKDKRQRRKILEFNYGGTDHISVDSVEAECVELMESDPAQAERFFGGRVVAGSGSWLPDQLWESAWADTGGGDGRSQQDVHAGT